jgi:hypothetical protein
MNVYTQGDIVVSRVTFREGLPGGLAGPAVDPSTVTFYYQPNGAPPSETITYTDATEPSIGTIARIGVGRYITWIDTIDFLGPTLEVWPKTPDASYQVTGWKRFLVNPIGGLWVPA